MEDYVTEMYRLDKKRPCWEEVSALSMCFSHFVPQVYPSQYDEVTRGEAEE
jgi:hypothetical protein